MATGNTWQQPKTAVRPEPNAPPMLQKGRGGKCELLVLSFESHSLYKKHIVNTVTPTPDISLLPPVACVCILEKITYICSGKEKIT